MCESHLHVLQGMSGRIYESFVLDFYIIEFHLVDRAVLVCVCVCVCVCV